jgi:hypothetical protein
MADVPATATVPEAAHPSSIEVRELRQWAMFAGAPSPPTTEDHS